jgi:hypothetical protein
MQLSAQEFEKLTMTVPDMLSNAKASTRASTVLKNEGLLFAAQLLAYAPQDLRRIPNAGKSVYRDIVRVIASHGLRVGALQDYGRELVECVPSICGEFMKRASVPQRDGVIDLNAVKARQAFGEHLLSIPSYGERPRVSCDPSNISDWINDCFNHYIGITPEFLKAGFSNLVDVGNVGLHLPRAAKHAGAGLRFS